jgi:hypothetical protein
MAICPRCGNDADQLAGDAFSLLYCEFCGDTIDTTDLAPRDDVDRTIQRLLPAPTKQPPIPYDAQVA